MTTDPSTERPGRLPGCPRQRPVAGGYSARAAGALAGRRARPHSMMRGHGTPPRDFPQAFPGAEVAEWLSPSPFLEHW